MVLSKTIAQVYVNKEWVKFSGAPDALDWTATTFDAQGNIIIVGNTLVAPGNPDILISKLDGEGNLIWQRTYAGPANAQDYGMAVASDQLGYSYVAGIVTTSVSGLDIAVLKYSANGTLLWSRTWNGASNLIDAPSCIALGEDGSVYVGGTSYATAADPDFVVLKWDNSGTSLWSATYDYNNLTDAATGIIVDGEALAVTGASASGTNSWDYATVKLDAGTGAQLDVARVTVPGVGLDNALDFTADNEGNLFITGYREVGGHKDIQTVKLNTAFNVAWVRTFDGGYDDIARSVDDDGNGNIYVTGSTRTASGVSNFITLKYNGSGTELWRKYYKAQNPAWSAEGIKLATTTDGGVVVVGAVHNGTGYNFQTLKYRANGDLEWEKEYDGLNGDDKALDLLVDAGGKVYVSGVSGSPNGNTYTTVKYAATELENGLLLGANGNPYCRANELLIRFRSEAVSTDVTNDKDWQFGKLGEVVPTSVAEAVGQMVNLPQGYGKEIPIYKVYRNVTPADSVSTTRLGREEALPPVWCTFLLEVDLGAIPNDMVADVASLTSVVDFAQLNYFYPFLADPLTGYQESLFPTTQLPNGDINVESAWAITSGIPEVRVGIVDEFINYTHEDFNVGSTTGSSIVDGYEFYQSHDYIGEGEDPPFHSHGTACAGIIGAIRNNNLGVAGIAGKDAELASNTGCSMYTLGIAVLDTYGSFSTVIAPAVHTGTIDTDDATVNYACNVLNNSYGASGITALDMVMREAVRVSYRNECVFVAARGNGDSGPHYPVDFGNAWDDHRVIGVGAAGPNGSLMTLSNGGNTVNYGGSMDLIAPGTQGMIATTVRAGGAMFPFAIECDLFPDGYGCFRGSSAAAAHASGVAALMLSAHNIALGAANNLAPEDVEIIMEKGATEIGSSYGYPDGPDEFNGHGRLNAGGAVELVTTPYRIFHSGAPDVINTTTMPVTSVTLPATGGWNYNWGLLPGTYQMEQRVYDFEFTNTFGPDVQILDAWGRKSGVYGNFPAYGDFDATWEFNINGNTATVNAQTTIWRVLSGPEGPLTNYWIPANPSKVSTPYSLHLHEPFSVGLEEDRPVDFSLFPNPTSSELRINLNATGARFLEVIDVTGRIIQHQSIALGTTQVQLSVAELAQGTYTVRLSNTERSFAQRFIKY